MTGFFLNEPLSKLDPDVKKVIDLEAERQKRKLILIPSESSAPAAIRESLGSILQNLYAEGYPSEASRLFSQEEILDIEKQIAHYRRYSDPRYYKGVEFADILEELARRRCAELFANKQVAADDIFVNVQPLSGAPANNAVYHALINPGDGIIGMNLFSGGHLTHGSSVNRSGELYKAFHYNVDPKTEQIDYQEVEKMVLENKPRIIVAGYSSYPWAPDWKKFRQIADKVGAYLFADISHIAGMVAAGVIPSPVGFADIITFTTHKSLCGPRGACILSFKQSISKKIDKAVFPGEQGGPHVHVYAALATTFKLAKEKSFIDFQKQIVKNCAALNKQLESRGLRIAYGGTNTHLTNVDCKTVKGSDGTPLSGDMAARILDIAGLVANSNTIPGDKSAMRASGVRLGTPWMTQRGLVEKDMVEVADIIADLLLATNPYTYKSGSSKRTRAKIDFEILEQAKMRVRAITQRALGDENTNISGYPHFYFLDDELEQAGSDNVAFEICGENVRESLNYILMSDVESLSIGESQSTSLKVNGQLVKAVLTCEDEDSYILSVPSKQAALTAAWLRDLSDSYINFDEDLIRRIPGPFIVRQSDRKVEIPAKSGEAYPYKPFNIGMDRTDKASLPSLPDFKWQEKESSEIFKTSLHDRHVELGAKMVPFAGWDMPVWYSSVLEEHMATRNAAGLFDVSHMGVYQAEGVNAVAFLDCVCANDISALKIGESCYTHFLDPDANVLDDLLVYHHAKNKYLVVVNAANDDKDWAWLNAVKDHKVKVDNERPWAYAFGTGLTLLNLRDRKAGDGMRVDIALQGPKSREILCKIGLSKMDIERIKSLKRTQLGHVTWNNLDLIVSRTGYTGEKMAFEIFVHPDKALDFWNKLLEVGTDLGLKPCGLGARDSLRTEAGLPLYGHEMGGDLNLGVGDAGFGAYVKTYKPWFIGRQAFLKKEEARKSVVVRFKFEDKRVRMAHHGDIVLNEKGKVIGQVTSCAIDKEEFLTGQAYIDNSSIKEGTTIYIYQNSQAIELDIQNSKQGSRLQLPEKATVLRRFPRL